MVGCWLLKGTARMANRPSTIHDQRPLWVLLLLFAALCVGGCRARSRVDDAIDRGAAYLASRQSGDGAWRSGVHGVFRDGTALTPHVLRSISVVRRESQAVDRAKDWMARVDPDRLAYPTYAAADASRVLEPERWLKLLRSRQLTGATAGPNAGGWAYPPGPMDPHAEANTSVTAFAACALADAGATPEDPALAAARAFLLRCRNDDGGFRFGVADTADNKAGPGISYGSATADAVRGLLATGMAGDDPVLVEAIDWLLSRLDPGHVSGDFIPARQPMRDGNYFYYLDALTDAFVRAGVPRHRWTDRIAAELCWRQQSDGSWENLLSAGREDDPIVATAFAIRVLSRCRPGDQITSSRF
jgi:squalene cyclase